MFAKAHLVRNMFGVCFCEVLLCVVLFVMGVAMTKSTHYRLALGPRFATIAGGFIFVGICYGLTAIVAYCGSKHHNKFLLLVHLGGITSLATFQALIAFSGLLHAVPDYSYSFQDVCLTNSLLNNASNVQTCTPYFESDLYNQLRASWRSYYSDNVADQTQSMNDSRPLTSSDSTPRQLCSRNKGTNYPGTPLCYTESDKACAFDEPIGSCGVTGAGALSKGCASAFHYYHASTLYTICLIVLILLAFPIIGGCTTLCLCFKRKEEDVIPTNLRISVRPAQHTKVYCRADVEKAEAEF
ncbi:hypothetical protein ACHHYP_08458 [Achlya hypogyna]|uniref:Uncharacterized protein n=1 Tax=Achlya hypogyna TaxID=1202772 RepID=A0A1V9YP72_ACHHY|nr:hypothetical protein ACHHYP_08458 [Achlya hypogyna]